MNICFASIKKINTLLRKKKISVYELTNEFLKNIKKNNSKVNALIYINEENALRKSKFIDNLIAKKKIEIDGLVGIPVANKDTFETKSMPTTFGSKIFENYKPTFNASTVQNMEDAYASHWERQMSQNLLQDPNLTMNYLGLPKILMIYQKLLVVPLVEGLLDLLQVFIQ